MSNPESKPETSAPTSESVASVTREQLDLLIERSIVAETESGRYFEAVDLGTAIKAVMVVFRASKTLVDCVSRAAIVAWLEREAEEWAARGKSAAPGETFFEAPYAAGVIDMLVADLKSGRAP